MAVFRFFACLLACAVVFLVVQSVGQRYSRQNRLVVYCAAGLHHAIQPFIDAFEQQRGVRIRTRFGGSGELVSLIELDDSVDVFIGADVQYNRRLETNGLVDDSIPLMTQSPVLVLNRRMLESNDGLKKLFQYSPTTEVDWGDDKSLPGELLTTRLRWSLAKPGHAAIGDRVSDLLTAPVYQRLIENSIVTHPTVTQVLGDLQSGVANAGFLWDTMPVNETRFLKVNLFGETWHDSTVAASILDQSDNKVLAGEFIEFCRLSIDQPVAGTRSR